MLLRYLQIYEFGSNPIKSIFYTVEKTIKTVLEWFLRNYLKKNFYVTIMSVEIDIKSQCGFKKWCLMVFSTKM